MKKKLFFTLLLATSIGIYFVSKQNNKTEEKTHIITPEGVVKPIDKTKNKRQLYAIERDLYEFNLQKNPSTGKIPREEKQQEFETSLALKTQKELQRATSSSYTSRGPSNLGGRTRAFAVDIADASSNIMLSGGVSSGLFRSTNGGASWVKVSAQGEVHNVTALAQDPRAGFQNIWYYGTGEFTGNSAALGAPYLGHGIYKSIDNGVTWTKIPGTDSDFTVYNRFDLISKLVVSPINGDLFIAALNRVYRYDGVNFIAELQDTSSGNDWTDVVVTNSGKVFAAIDGSSTDENGVWVSPTGNGSWTRIAENGAPSNWASTGRIVLATAPSNDDTVYALYQNGNSGGVEADLWKYIPVLNNWANYTGKMPDEAGGDSAGNDPFAIQGGYDLVVSVKPNDENFVVIGGTNAYKIANITSDPTFTRIGGYLNNTGYAQYNVGGVTHHPDIHVLKFDPNNNDVLFSGTDGGVHKTTDVNAASVTWVNLNNDYVTYQYYHVALDPKTGSNIVIGGAQDNGTTMGGTDAGLPDNSTMNSIFSGDGVAVALARRNGGQNLQRIVGVQNGRIWSDYPSGFTEVTPTGANSQFVTYFHLDPDNNDNLYYAGQNTLYTTSNAENITATTWTNAGILSTGENLRTFATTRGTYDPFTSFLLIGGGSGGVFKVGAPAGTTNIGNARNITPSGATTFSGAIVSDIAIHPTNPDIAIAVYANYGIDNIFITSNATTNAPTWTMVERNLSSHSIRSAEIVTVGAETIYFVGTARGLYSSTDPTSEDWEMEGPSTIGLSVVSGLVYRPADNKLLIGTHGNGMFETTVEGTLSSKDFKKIELEVSVYPNPAQLELNITSKTLNLNNTIEYTIFDISGKKMVQGKASNKKINIESLNPGIYLVNLTVDSKKQSIKFIKE